MAPKFIDNRPEYDGEFDGIEQKPIKPVLSGYSVPPLPPEVEKRLLEKVVGHGLDGREKFDKVEVEEADRPDDEEHLSQHDIETLERSGDERDFSDHDFVEEEPRTFREALRNLINTYSKENGSNTPDFLLAEYLDAQLTVFDITMHKRDHWYRPETEVDEAMQPQPPEQTPTQDWSDYVPANTEIFHKTPIEPEGTNPDGVDDSSPDTKPDSSDT